MEVREDDDLSVFWEWSSMLDKINEELINAADERVTFREVIWLNCNSYSWCTSLWNDITAKRTHEMHSLTVLLTSLARKIPYGRTRERVNCVVSVWCASNHVGNSRQTVYFPRSTTE